MPQDLQAELNYEEEKAYCANSLLTVTENVHIVVIPKLTRVVLEKRLLNICVCVSVYFVLSQLSMETKTLVSATVLCENLNTSVSWE